MSQQVRQLLWFIARFVGGGLLSWGAPRMLVALGVPLDRWIVDIGELIKLNFNEDTALWMATVVIGLVLFLSSVPIAKRQTGKPTTKPVPTTGDALASFQRGEWRPTYRPLNNADAPSRSAFTTKTVRQLRALYEGRTRLQADAFIADEKGKFIEVEGAVQNIDSGMAFLKIGNDANSSDFVECRFSEDWNGKLSTFRQGEMMKIQGVIAPHQNGAQIYLQSCKII